MADARATHSSGPAQRTFDCPWCGAIARIPADHLGEHFTCPECRKGTKLTSKNTTNLAPTAPDPDAPHLSGDRTFDCPWCGAISSIPSSHLGEHFGCPECKRQTKLTEKNTSRRPPSEPPPDAPHVETTSGSKAAIAALVLAAVGVGAWLVLSSKKTDDPKRTTETAAATPTPSGPTGSASERSSPRPLDVAPPPKPVEPPRAAPSTASSLAIERAEAAVTDAKSHLLVAKAALDDVRRRLAPYAGSDAETARQNLAALRQVSEESASLRSKMGEDATAEDARGHNFAMVQHVDGSPARVRVVEAALERMAKEPWGREVAGLTWREINFYGASFRAALASLEAAWSASSQPVPDELRAEEAKAKAAVAAAEREVADAQAALAAARGS